MRLFLMSLATLVFATAATAQSDESRFATYNAYENFVDSSMMLRKFVPLLKRLGGNDEYTPEQMAATDRQLKGVWTSNFNNVSVFNRKDLGGGIWQEGRVYWNGMSYAYYYALLHQREDALIVVNFSINASSQPIIEKF